MATKTIRLTSSSLVFTPGFVAYLRRAVQTQKAWAFKCVRDGYDLDAKAAKALLLGPSSNITTARSTGLADGEPDDVVVLVVPSND